MIPSSPFLLDERVFLHIGILKIAAVLEADGYSVDVLDFSGVKNSNDVLDNYFASNKDVTVGITATTPQIPFGISIIQHLFKYKNKIKKTILGGPHVSLMHSAYKKELSNGVLGRASADIHQLMTFFDTLVCGDGEKAIFEALVTDLKIVDADDKKSILFLSDSDFDTLPMPARHLVDIDSYKYTIDGEKSISLIAQLGCPFKCAFCGGRNSPFLRKIRSRSTDSVLRELEWLHTTHGYKGFMFYDDELNVNKSMIPLMKEISLLQKKHNTKFKLRGFVKAELFNKDQAEAMYDAGFRWLLTGFESGDERILTNIEKMASKEDNTSCVAVAKAHGLKVKALMSIGHAGESIESINNTKQWLLDVKPEEFDCTIITTYPGSPYFDEAKLTGDFYTYTSRKTGDKLYQKNVNYLVDPDYYKGDPDGGYKSYVWTDHITAKNLVIERDKLEKEVREKLNINFNMSRPGIKFEHSMGQGIIPGYILKSSDK